MDGIPLASPEPAARPTLSRLEITVPEPSLVSEWNSENLHEFHSTSNRARTESDVEQRANRTRRSEPIPNKQYQNDYFEAVQSRTLPSREGNGTLELIEVIRSQELEIHRQKKFNEKQFKQLAQQAQLIQSLKEELCLMKPRVECVSVPVQTDVAPSVVSATAATQSDPVPMKRTKDMCAQTETERVEPEPALVLNHNFSRRSLDSTPPISNTDSECSKTSARSKSSTRSTYAKSMPSNRDTDEFDDDTDSDKELSAAELAQLVADVAPSRDDFVDLPAVAPPVGQPSTESVFIRALAPSYGQNKSNLTAYGEESLCEQLAKKYGVATAADKPTHRQSSHDETFQNSADMSLATAQYFERHSIGRARHRTRTAPSPAPNSPFPNKPIVDLFELEKLQNFK